MGPGAIEWRDLTVPNAGEVRDFYRAVAGWAFTEEDMGGYSDYSMVQPSSGEVVAGICHARGTNSAVPPQWLIYITVANMEESVRQCLALGGKVVDGPRQMGAGLFCVIQDPAGAVCALYRK